MLPRGGVSCKRGVPTDSARSRSDGIGTVGTEEAAGAGGRGGGRTRPRPWDSRRGVSPPGRWSRGPARPKAIVDSRGCAAPAAVAVHRRVRVETWSEDGFTVGGAEEPGEAGADAVPTASVPCVGLLEGVGWATAVAAAGACAEPMPTAVGTTKTDAKSLSVPGKARPRPAQRSTMATDAETRATNLPEGAERSSILMCGPCVQNRNSQRR